MAAGIGEEIAYRAVLYQLLLRITSSATLSFCLCVISFTLAHLAQGKRRLWGIAYIGCALHALYFMSGSLFMPILVHTIYNAVLLTAMYRNEVRSRATPVEEAEPNTSRMGAT